MRSTLLLSMLLFLIGCLPATHNAGVRRMAEHLYETERDSKKTEEYCISNGLEKTCGFGGSLVKLSDLQFSR